MKDLQELASLCHLCLNSTHFQEKRGAETQLALFVNQLAPHNLQELFASLDDSSIFVITSLLINTLGNKRNFSQWLTKTIELYSKWYSSDQKFLINGAPASYHLVGKLKQWLGELMKASYYQVISEDSKKQEMFMYFRNLNQQLKVLSYSSFIDAFSLIDHEIGFVKFRNYMYSFQRDWIPIMFAEVRDVLKKMHVDQEFLHLISSMQTSLTIENNKTCEMRVSDEKQFNLKKAESITELLRSLTSFKYNLDINQYQQGLEYDDPIHYPKLIDNTTRVELFHYSSIFITNLIRHFPDYSLTERFLSCYIKISSIPNSNEDFQNELVKSSIYMMQQPTPHSIMFQLLDFNNRILKMIPSFASFFLKERVLAVQWITNLLELAGKILRIIPVELKNVRVDHISRIFNVIFRGSSKSALKQFRKDFVQMAYILFQKYAGYLFSNNQCLIAENVKDPQEMISHTQEEFRKWVPTIFLFQGNLGLLKMIQMEIFSNVKNINNIINFNLLLTYLIRHHKDCFQENAHYQPISSEGHSVFGQIIKNCYIFCTLPTSLSIQSICYQTSQLYFFRQFLKSTIGSQENISLEHPDDFIGSFLPSFTDKKQEIIVECIAQICKRISRPDPTIIQFCFQILYQLAIYLDDNYQNRDLVSSIHQQLFKSYVTIASNSLNTRQTFRSRQSLFKNISSLLSLFNHYSIESCLNDLFSVISDVSYESESVKLLSQISDIKGIAKGISKPHHLQQFIEVILPKLAILNKVVFIPGTSHEIIKSALSIYNCILGVELPDGTKQDVEQSLNEVYQLILPYWASILNDYNQRSDGSERDLQTVLVIIEGFSLYFQDQSVNPYNNRDFTGLLIAILISCIKSQPLLQLLESECQVIIHLFSSLCDTIISAIFDLFNQNQIQIFCKFHLFMYQILMKHFRILSTNNNDETSKHHRLTFILKTAMQNLYQFILSRNLLIQPTMNSLKPNKIYTSTRLFISYADSVIYEVIYQMFKTLCLTWNKNQHLELFNSISIQIKCLCRTFPESQMYVLRKFQQQECSNQMEIKLKLVYQNLAVKNSVHQMSVEEIEEISTEYLESMLKDWVRSIPNKPTIIIDDY